MSGDRETELERQLAKARAAGERFMYIASHDLRAPLRAIKSLAEWAVEDLQGHQVPPSVHSHLATLVARVDRLDGMLQGLLEASQVARKHAEVEQVDTGALARQVAEAIELGQVRVEVAPDMPVIETSRHWLRRLFELIIDNAVRHHDLPDGNGSVAVSGKMEGERALFEIADDGPGIAPKLHEKAFEMFQSLGKPHCGVGLAVARAIVEHNGGALTIVSDGRGTCLRVHWVAGWPSDDGSIADG